MQHRAQSPDRSSPIRKMLAKKLVSYYDRLESSKSHSKSKSRGKSGKTPWNYNGNNVVQNTSTEKLKSKDHKFYEEELYSKKKFNKLQDLIKDEYRRTVANSGPFPPEEILSSPETKLEKAKQLNTSVEVVLAQKAIHASQNPESDPEPSESEEQQRFDRQPDDIFDEKLYHLNTKKVYLHQTPFDQEAYDFHQRKSKEIRRLQYVAQLRSPQRISPVKKRVAKKEKKPNNRLKEDYPVWVLDRRTGIPHPAVMSCKEGFRINPVDDLLEIREGDPVNVKIIHPGDGRRLIIDVPDFFFGTTRKREPGDGDCDFVVEDPDFRRYPIQINFRYRPPEPPRVIVHHPPPPRVVIQHQPTVVIPPPRQRVVSPPPAPVVPPPNEEEEEEVEIEVEVKKEEPPHRDVDGTNCKLYDPNGDFLGRARLDIDGNKYVKAILVENGKIYYLLMSRISDDEVMIKGSNLKKYKEKILIEEIQKINSKDGKTSADLHILTLEDGYDKYEVPKQIYYVDGPQFLDNSILLNEEIGIAVCENERDYIGTIDIAPEGDSMDRFKLQMPRNGTNGNMGFVHVVLDDKLPNQDGVDGFVDIVKKAASSKTLGPKILNLPDSFKDLWKKETKNSASETQRVTIKHQNFGTNEKKKKTKESSTNQCLFKTVESGVQTSEDLLRDYIKNNIDQKIEFGIEDYNGSNLHVTVRQKSPEKGGKNDGKEAPIYSNFTVTSYPKKEGEDDDEERDNYSAQYHSTTSQIDNSMSKKRRSKNERRASKKNITASVENYSSNRSSTPKDYYDRYSSVRVTETHESNRKTSKRPPRTPKRENERFSSRHERIFKHLDVSPRMSRDSNLIKYLRYIENRAARTIQRIWREYKKNSKFENQYRRMFGNEETYQKFLQFYKTLPKNVDHEKAFFHFKIMLEDIIPPNGNRR